MLRWPDARTVDEVVRRWARKVAQERTDVCGIGYFGSYARGDWGVGSDLDLIVVVDSSEVPFIRRAAAWDTTGLPVPADLLVYTKEEWEALGRQGKVSEAFKRETVWVHLR